MLKKPIKILVILVLFYQTSVYSKSTSFDDFNSRNLSNYFSGIIAYENKDNIEALKFFSASKILLNKHDKYLKRYVYSLVLEDKIAQAINVIKNSSNKDNSDFFESHILLITDSLKKNDFKTADKYLKKTLKFKEQNRFNLVIIETLKQIEKIETATEPLFQDYFVKAMSIPHESDDFSELKKIFKFPEKNNVEIRSKRKRRRT